MILHRITESCTEWFSICSSITLKVCNIAIFKALSKKIKIQIKLLGMSVIFHYTKLHLSKCNSSWVFFIKQNMNFNFQPSSTLAFLVFHVNDLIKSCSFFWAECKMLWSHIDWCKFCIYLRSLNVCHFGMVEAKVDKGDRHTNRQTGGWCHKATFFL
jgi:hypothetical protein